MADEAIKRFEVLTSQTADTKTLIRATYESVDIIAPWIGATSNSDAVHTVLTSLRAEAKGFVSSVTKSFDNAQSGYEFAATAESVCKAILDPINTDKQIQDLIMEMREIAQQAHKEATDTANSFRANRIGFNNILASIPDARGSVDHEHEQAKGKKDRAEHKAESWGTKITKIRAHKKKNVATNLITMPYVAFAKSRVHSSEGKAQELGTKITKFEDAANSLHGAERGLTDLMGKMNTLADYWLAMDAVLEDMHGRIQDLRINSVFRSKIERLSADWKQVGLNYRVYKAELVRLKDLNPTIKVIMQGT